MSTASEESTAAPHGAGGLCIEHSSLDHLLMVRLGIIVARRGTGISMQAHDIAGKQHAFVFWKCRTTGEQQTRSAEAPTKAQALVLLIEMAEGEQSGERPPRAAVFSA